MNAYQFLIEPINLILLSISVVALGVTAFLAKHLSQLSTTPSPNLDQTGKSKFNIRLHLSQKIFGLSLLITITPLVIFSLISFYNTKEMIITRLIGQLEVIADLKVDRVRLFFETITNDIRATQDDLIIRTNFPIVSQYTSNRSNPNYSRAKSNLDNQLESLRKTKKLIELMLLDPDGNLVYSTEHIYSDANLGQPLPPALNRSVESGKSNITFSNPLKHQFTPSGFEMIVTAPLLDSDNSLLGIIAFVVDMGPIYESIQDTTGLGSTGETLIGRKMKDHYLQEVGGHYASKPGDHAIFLHPLRYDPDAALVRDVYVGDHLGLPMQQAAILGQNGSGISIDYRQEPVVAAWRHMPDLNWGLVAKIDTKEAFIPILKVRDQTIFLGLVLFTIITLITRFVTRTISSPIEKMTLAAKKISQGDYSARIKINNRDEIGQLASHFNDMVDAVQSTQKDLTKKIELLEKFNQAVVGREVKMVELKNEISRLKSLNQTPGIKNHD